VGGSTVYRKSDKGKQEVADNAFGLEKHIRRLLILVDGRRDAAELSVYIRAGEFESTLNLLLAEGFVEEGAAGDVDPGRVPQAPVANDPVIFAGIKIKAMTEVRSRLGGAAHLLVNEINQCSTPLELRERLRKVEDALVQLMGKAEGVALARRIGSELTKLIPKG
jgi:hypothetical protein